MDDLASKPPSNVILSKSLALIEKTYNQLQQLDKALFPTDTSDTARKLLVNALGLLRNTKHLEPIAPEVLYNRLIKLQGLVSEIELSSTDHISWPVVSYCTEIWGKLFPSGDTKIFFTLTKAHNYVISLFSTELREILTDLLPEKIIDELITEKIYCLRLASIEDDNLPLYANIAHEFGHAVYNKKRHVLRDIWWECFETVQDKIGEQISSSEPDTTIAIRIKNKVEVILFYFAKELIADFIASKLVGVAFFLSLYEFSWGQNQSQWNIVLSPFPGKIKAYPSPNYRLARIKDDANLSEFQQKAKHEFCEHKIEGLSSILTFLENINLDQDNKTVNVYPTSASDFSTINKLLESHLSVIEEGLVKFIDRASTLLENDFGNAFIKTKPHNICKLLARLKNDIPPNIIPDGTLLGKPACFQCILLASALYRMHKLLSTKLENGTKQVLKDLRKVERLTTKAFEVSYAQQKFNTWKKDLENGNT